VVKIYYTNKFISSYKKLPELIKVKAEKNEKIFKMNPFDPRLDTHKLSGKLREYWSFSITGKYRIAVKFLGDKEVLFLKAGTHNIYRNS
jgi:mRNA-degrading endonuclease YafQ of YafQ-DinJ toxin-antitoxin module